MFYYDSFSPQALSGSQLDLLLAMGWYRMNQTIFTVSHLQHDNLYRVHWLRYAIEEIKTHASHQRIRRKNNAFRFTIEDFHSVRPDHAELYARYRASITFNGADSIEESMFGDYPTDSNIYNTKCISIYDQEKLIAGGYFDMGDFAAASILHFFDPNYSRHSLGKYLILITIDYLKSSGYRFYYPGYVVEGLSKMDYKLFLGRYDSQYFDPVTARWKYFKDSILIPSTTPLPENLESDDSGTGESSYLS